MRIGLHDEGLVLLTPEIPGEPSEAVRQERGGNGLRVYLKTPNAPGQRIFSRCAAPFFLEIRQYSCEKMSCSAQKFLAAGHIGSFQIHPKRIRGFAHSGDSFRRSRFRRASGGPIFSVLPEKMGGEKGRWGTFGAYCGCGSGRNLIFSCCEHTKPPYVRYGTRRLLWYTDFSSSCDSISAAKSLAFETCRVVRIRRSSFWCRTGAGAPPASLGEAGCGAKRSRLMRGYAAHLQAAS